jgi:hypothetical protein
MEPRAELRRRSGGAELSAGRLARAVEAISRDGVLFSFDATASCVRVRIAVSEADAVTIPVELLDGDRLVTAGASTDGPLTTWCFAAIGRVLDCDVFIEGERSANANGDLEANVLVREMLFRAARTDVADAEERLLEDRLLNGSAPPRDRAPVRAFLRDLVEDGNLVLAPGPARALAALEALIDAPRELYAALLDSPAVDELFLDEAG